MYIGIITYHRACNYGAYLQACALCNRLNMEEDIIAEIIDFRMKKENKIYTINKAGMMQNVKRILRLRYRFDKELFAMFEKAQLSSIMVKSNQYIESDSVDEFTKLVKNKYDVIIAGSDEIWKIDSFRGFPTPYWLIGDLGCRKFSYAASARVEFKTSLGEKDFLVLSKALNEFEYIGVRDRLTYDEVKMVVKDSSKLHMCCDPSFLFDFQIKKISIFELLNGKVKLNDSKKNLLLMTENRELASSVRRQLKDKFNIISVFHKHRGVLNISQLSPLEWLELLNCVDFVITSFFHATCYSIIFNQRFLSVGTMKRKTKLLELLNDNDEMLSHYVEIDGMNLKETKWENLIENTTKLSMQKDFILKQQKTFEKFLRALRNAK